MKPKYKARFKSYLALTKPGIVRGNALTAAAGFMLAASARPNVGLLAAMLIGLSLVIAAACVFNNYIDRDIDRLMARTRGRALVKGSIEPRAAINYGVILLSLGVIVLYLFTNLLTLAMALIGFIFYVFVYGYAKRHTVFGTEVGSISGAIPPVVGYVAVAGRLDLAAGIIFLILVLWQMPHFYAIAMYRLQDYSAAKIPVLPAVHGLRATKYRILAYIVAFVVATAWLTLAGYTGMAYALVTGLLGITWLAFGIVGLRASDDTLWARKMFRFSLLVITGFCIMIALDAVLP